MKNLLQDKTILITGSSRGIGAATAKLAKEYGARIILHGRAESDQLKKLAKELDAQYIFCPVEDRKQVMQKAADLMKKYNIDALVNSAGVVDPKPFLETVENDWLNVYKVNLIGSVNFCQALIPHMLKNGQGKIVNVSSIRGLQSGPGIHNMAYSASKAAVISLTSALAKEFGPTIQINSVAPGFTMTEISVNWPKDMLEKLEKSLPKRAAKPEEIAKVILFLASDGSDYVNGQTFIADGGHTITTF